MKVKKYAVLCCVISLVFALALVVTAFFLLGSYEAQTPNNVLAYLFRFFFITTPGMIVLTLITIIRVKVNE